MLRSQRRTGKVLGFSLSSLALLAALGCATIEMSATGPSSDTARYEVTFVPSWNPATHPTEYPVSHARQGFLTPMIGATHNSGYSIFDAGREPTPGLELLSEKGKPDLLKPEIDAAIQAGAVGNAIEFAEGSAGPVHPPVRTTFAIDANHPMVSIAGMIAPSPDWFLGVSGLELRKNGRWVATAVVEAYAWDSGGDGGTTYLAEDADLNPKQKTRKADTSHFMRGGSAMPVGAFVFKLIPSE